jgi:hypothetical protein
MARRTRLTPSAGPGSSGPFVRPAGSRPDATRRITRLGGYAGPARRGGPFTREAQPPVPEVVLGHAVSIRPRRRRKLLDFTFIATGGVAVGGAAQIWFNDIDISDQWRGQLSAKQIEEEDLWLIHGILP